MNPDALMLAALRRKAVDFIDQQVLNSYGVKTMWDLFYSDNGKLGCIKVPFNLDKYPEIARFVRIGIEEVSMKDPAKTMNPCAEIPLPESQGMQQIRHPIPKTLLLEIMNQANKTKEKEVGEALDLIGEGLLAAAQQGKGSVEITLYWTFAIEEKVRQLYSHMLEHIHMTGLLNQAKVTFVWANDKNQKNDEFLAR
jgi:hypothetical protein